MPNYRNTRAVLAIAAGLGVLASVQPSLAGTTGKVAKFTAPTAVDDSIMTESGSRIGVNTTNPFDTMHVVFDNAFGSLTGYAVQNLSGAANAYSGNLFYDQNGALGLFQGFNNSSHEYRINNVASTPSINFMTGSTSRFFVNSSGNIGIGTTSVPAGYRTAIIGSATNPGLLVRNSGVASTIDIDTSGGFEPRLGLGTGGIQRWRLSLNPTSSNNFEIRDVVNDLLVMQIAAGNGLASLAAGLTVSGGALTVNNGIAVNSGGITITAGGLTVNSGNITNIGVLTNIGGASVFGAFTATGTKNFAIDHPADPSKTIYHAAAESNEVINFYSGNVVTGADGKATVKLPDYFGLINKDPRYNLTVVGVFAQAIISKEVANNEFEISTSVPNVKVSWEVKAVRNDPYMQAHPYDDVRPKSAEAPK